MTWSHVNTTRRQVVFGRGAHEVELFSAEARARRFAQLVDCERLRCPCCGQTCWAEPMRPGAIRLVSPDGTLHKQTCPELSERTVERRRYRPQPIPLPVPVIIRGRVS